MAKQLPLGSLPTKDREQLEALLQKDAGSLTPAERAHLRARRDYLSADQREYYGADKKAPKTQAGQEGEGETAFDRKAAKARLKELGVDFKGNAKNEELKALLAEHDTEEEGEDE